MISDPDLDRLVATTGTVEPRPETRERYAPLQEQFIAAFAALRPIYSALHS